MQAFITNLLVALACGSMVQAAPSIDARQAVLTSCPDHSSNVGESSSLDPVWKNVCCAYNINTVCDLFPFEK